MKRAIRPFGSTPWALISSTAVLGGFVVALYLATGNNSARTVLLGLTLSIQSVVIFATLRIFADQESRRFVRRDRDVARLVTTVQHQTTVLADLNTTMRNQMKATSALRAVINEWESGVATREAELRSQYRDDHEKLLRRFDDSYTKVLKAQVAKTAETTREESYASSKHINEVTTELHRELTYLLERIERRGIGTSRNDQ